MKVEGDINNFGETNAVSPQGGTMFVVMSHCSQLVPFVLVASKKTER